MSSVTLLNGVLNYQTEKLDQWDCGQELNLSNYSYGGNPVIHFANKKSKKALVVSTTLAGGVLTAPIPNSLLREPYDITAYLYIYKNDSGNTQLTITIPVEPRIEPDDYVFTEDERLVTLSEVQKEIDDMIEKGTKALDAAIKNLETNAGLLPTVTTDDNDKMLQVIEGVWTMVKITDSEGVNY